GVVLVEQALAHARTEVHRLVRAPRVWIAVHRGAIVVAAEGGPVRRHAMDRIVLAQGPVDRVRIVQEGRVEPLEVEPERERAGVRHRAPPAMNGQTRSGASQWALWPAPGKSRAAGSTRPLQSSATRA